MKNSKALAGSPGHYVPERREQSARFLSKFLLFIPCFAVSLSACQKSVAPELINNVAGNNKKEITGQTLAGTWFRIAVIPDTQMYTGKAHGGVPGMFHAQIQWIKDHQADSNIVYVAGLGDIVDDTEDDAVLLEQQWRNASSATTTYGGGYYALESPAPGIPYGVAVGNHDEADNNYDQSNPGQYHNHPGITPVRNTTENFNQYFGVAHFSGKPYYGGHANISGKNNNDCHFDRFTVGTQKYIVLYMAFDNATGSTGEDVNGLMTAWARTVLQNNLDSKAIIVSHSIINSPSTKAFSNQGLRIYNAVKDKPNVFLMLCGHVTGEAYRQDVFNGNTIKTYLTDYQSNTNGGNGKMRTMRINTATNAINIRTFSPYLGQ